MLLFAVITVFIGGLMVGRTPEYLGKKIRGHRGEVRDCWCAGHADDGVGAAVSPGDQCTAGSRPRNSRSARVSEILYAYISQTKNNGSAFGGINANTPWYNIT